MTQLLRLGMDEAPAFLVEAKTKLLDPEIRAAIDSELRDRVMQSAVVEFKKVLEFAISHGELASSDEERLYEAGEKLGLLRDEMRRLVDVELEKSQAVRVEKVEPAPAPEPAPAQQIHLQGGASAPSDPFTEFRRVLRLSKLCLDGDDLTDDQRDALCNMGESLGLTGGEAEDLIDEYLEEAESGVIKPVEQSQPRAARPAAPSGVQPKPAAAPQPKGSSSTVVAPKAPAPVQKPEIVLTPMLRIQERARYRNFINPIGIEMMLVPSGVFQMGSSAREALPHEQPVLKTTVTCFYISRFPITNEQYEQFDASHVSKRATWATGAHPVVFVSSEEAIAFCNWLSSREGKKYRLPTEAEWEYAARGSDNRVYPWGERLDGPYYANFADKIASTGTTPVGSFPKGASQFGMEDMAGNVMEWCLDYFDFYKSLTKERVNPRGPMNGQRRVCRGGSWRSRAVNLRTSARAFNQSQYAANDVGFRIVCECAKD